MSVAGHEAKLEAGRWQSAQLTRVTASRTGAGGPGVWMNPALIFRQRLNGAGMSF
jgi:hypothetical protein